MLLATTLWLLYLGPFTVGSYPTLAECQAEAAWRLNTQPQFRDKRGACARGSHVVRFDEKTLPANLRKGR